MPQSTATTLKRWLEVREYQRFLQLTRETASRGGTLWRMRASPSSSGVEISHGLALTICTVIIAVITVGGGLVSVAYSDAVSALLMVGGFFAAIPILMAAASAQGAALPPEKMTITGGMSGWELLGYFLPSLALMLGDQNMLQRFASAKNSDEAKKSNIGMFIGEILVIISIVLIVTQAAKLYPTLETPSNVIFQVAVDYLPLVFGALVMCACMAFIVTTADSYLLSSATNLTNDVYVKYIRKDATDRQKMLVLRGTIIGHGNVPVKHCLHLLKAAGFDGTISIEFEGMEPCVDAVRIGLANLKKYWSEV